MMINAWKIEIVVPLLAEEEREALFDKVAQTVMDWVPENRTYDPDVSSHGTYDYLYDTRTFAFDEGDRVRVKTLDGLNSNTGVIMRIEPSENGLVPYDVLLDDSPGGLTVPFEEDELELEVK
jgi:hypothetical protein